MPMTTLPMTFILFCQQSTHAPVFANLFNITIARYKLDLIDNVGILRSIKGVERL